MFHWICFIHFSVYGHLTSFHFGGILSKATVNMHTQVFVCIYAFILLSRLLGTFGLTLCEAAKLFTKMAAPGVPTVVQ